MYRKNIPMLSKYARIQKPKMVWEKSRVDIPVVVFKGICSSFIQEVQNNDVEGLHC